MEAFKQKKLEYFELVRGRYPALEDMRDLKDRVARQRLKRRLERAERGNYGIHRRFGDFLELIVHFGPGYRIYLGEDGPLLVILLVVGDKSTQTSDFKEARAYWEAYKTGFKRRG